MSSLHLLVLVLGVVVPSTPSLAGYFKPPNHKSPVQKPLVHVPLPVYKPPMYYQPKYKPPVLKPPVYKQPVEKPPIIKPPYEKPPIFNPPYEKPPVYYKSPMQKPPTYKPPEEHHRKTPTEHHHKSPEEPHQKSRAERQHKPPEFNPPVEETPADSPPRYGGYPRHPTKMNNP